MVRGSGRQVKGIAHRSPNIGIPLLAARACVKKALGLGSRRATKSHRWSSIRPAADKLIQECLDDSEFGRAVLQDDTRWVFEPRCFVFRHDRRGPAGCGIWPGYGGLWSPSSSTPSNVHGTIAESCLVHHRGRNLKPCIGPVCLPLYLASARALVAEHIGARRSRHLILPFCQNLASDTCSLDWHQLGPAGGQPGAAYCFIVRYRRLIATVRS